MFKAPLHSSLVLNSHYYSKSDVDLALISAVFVLSVSITIIGKDPSLRQPPSRARGNLPRSPNSTQMFSFFVRLSSTRDKRNVSNVPLVLSSVLLCKLGR